MAGVWDLESEGKQMVETLLSLRKKGWGLNLECEGRGLGSRVPDLREEGCP